MVSVKLYNDRMGKNSKIFAVTKASIVHLAQSVCKCQFLITKGKLMGTLFRCCCILGNIFNLPDAGGKAMLCSYFLMPDLPEPVLRLG